MAMLAARRHTRDHPGGVLLFWSRKTSKRCYRLYAVISGDSMAPVSVSGL